MGLLSSRAASKSSGSDFEAVLGDINKFVRAMRFEPTWQQQQVLDAVQAAPSTGNRYIAVRSGQGPGKTTVSAITGLWKAMQAHTNPETGHIQGAEVKVTAPTMRQCIDVWLKEARNLLGHAEPWLRDVFTVTKTKIEVCGVTGWGVSFVTANREENAQGAHNPNLVVIGEEASGIKREIITQFKGTLSNPNSLFLLIGNPNTLDCAFYDCFYGPDSRSWVRLAFNAEDTARDYPHIVDPARNEALEREFGRESDVYRVRVLGEFPNSDPNTVIPLELVKDATEQGNYIKALRAHTGSFGVLRQFGLDFARYGGDENVVFRRQGNAIVEWAKFVRTDPSVLVDRAFRMQADAEWSDSACRYIADAGGIGQGVMRRFYEANKRITEFHNGGTSNKPRQYANKITEAWFGLASLLRQGNVYIPDDHLLVQQLSTRQYFTDKAGRLILESKPEYQKRGFESPDRADALVLTFWNGAMSQPKIASGSG